MKIDLTQADFQLIVDVLGGSALLAERGGIVAAAAELASSDARTPEPARDVGSFRTKRAAHAERCHAVRDRLIHGADEMSKDRAMDALAQHLLSCDVCGEAHRRASAPTPDAEAEGMCPEGVGLRRAVLTVRSGRRSTDRALTDGS